MTRSASTFRFLPLVGLALLTAFASCAGSIAPQTAPEISGTPTMQAAPTLPATPILVSPTFPALPPPPEGILEKADAAGTFHPGPDVKPAAWEELAFENNRDSLVNAIDNQLRFLATRGSRGLRFGGTRKGIIAPSRQIATLLAFRTLVGDAYGTPGFQAALKDRFALYQSVANDQVLFTGYYLPILDGASIPSETFSVPLYAHPPARPRGLARSTHAQIDAGALRGRGLEIAWVRSKMDRFFLMIQGSGYLRYPDGSLRSVRYAGGNKRRYTAIGRLLVEDGKIPQSEISMQRIRQYFAVHPEDADHYLHRCASFIFFRIDDVQPHGVHGIRLTADQSIATDASIFGTGLLGFADYPRPTAAPTSGPAPVRRAIHFVLSQDVGGAIKGPDHVDIFTGLGDRAAIPAGFLQHKGRLFFFVVK